MGLASSHFSVVSAEGLKGLVNQPLDIRLLPPMLEFLYKAPSRAGMLPPMIHIATSDDKGNAAVVCFLIYPPFIQSSCAVGYTGQCRFRRHGWFASPVWLEFAREG